MNTLDKVEGQVIEAKSWFLKHERLLIVIFILAAVLFLGNKFIDNRADRAEQRAIVAEQVLKQQEEVVKQMAANTAASNAKYDLVIEALSKQNQTLLTGITARNQQLAQSQQAAQTLPLPELALQWKALAKLPDGSVTAKPSGIEVTEAGARQTVSELLRLPVLEANLADTQTVVKNKDKAITEANGVISTQKAEIVGLKDLNVKKDASCKADVDVVKADAAKSKRNWFVRGAIAGGIVAGYVLKLIS